MIWCFGEEGGCRDGNLCAPCAEKLRERLEASESELDDLRAWRSRIKDRDKEFLSYRDRVRIMFGAANARANKAEAEVAILKEQRDRWHAKATQLAGIEDERDRLRAALEEVEWVWCGEFEDDGYVGCAWCKWHKYQDHAPDCPRQIALGKDP